MDYIPFLRPSVPTVDTYLHRLQAIDASHYYSNYGPLNTEFESRMVAESFSGEGHALTVSNATAGLALALRLLGRPGARFVPVPSFTFAATALAIRWAGYEPYFVDVDPTTWVVDADKLVDVVSALGSDCAAVMPYATFGIAMDLAPYEQLQNAGVPVIVDAAASLGTVVGGKQFGTGFSGTVVYSMHATKPFSVGEAGLIYSNDAEAIAMLRRGGNFGFNAGRAAELDGFNTKMSEMTAAVALSTLDSFASRMDSRASVHRAYTDAFAANGMSSEWVTQPLIGRPAHQFFPVLCPAGKRGDDVVEALESRSIQARRYFAPACHEQPVFADARHGDLSNTTVLSERIVSLPLWDGLTNDQVERIVEALAGV